MLSKYYWFLPRRKKPKLNVKTKIIRTIMKGMQSITIWDVMLIRGAILSIKARNYSDLAKSSI